MNMHREISAETQAVLLLCGHFAPKEPASPLELRELNRLVDVLGALGSRTSDLLDGAVLSEDDWRVAKLDRERVLRLLERGAAMALAVERWTSAGLWIVARGEVGYPSRLLGHLGRSAPAVLFGVGDAANLERGGLAIVGSRDVDEAGGEFTDAVARQCAREGVAVVSGGARGVDEIALAAAFDEGGRVAAALPEGLGKASVAAKYRNAIRDERLVLVSPYAPHAPFSVGNAMGRNRLIYALADAALVVASAARSGGTWAGAEEELRRDRHHPVFVRVATPPIAGNEALLRIGGVSFPEQALHGGIADLLHEGSESVKTTARIADVESSDSLFAPRHETAAGPAAQPEPPPRIELSEDVTPREDAGTPKTAYDAVLPLLLELLDVPRAAKEIAELLDVAQPQAKKWLDRAVEENRIAKSGKPSKYRRTDKTSQQPTLFG